MKHQVIIAGAGGGTYHAMSQLGVWMTKRGDVELMVFDPDRVEERNKNRQWGAVWTGKEKVDALVKMLWSIGHVPNGISVVAGKFTEDCLLLNPEYILEGRVLWMLALTDNYESRVAMDTAGKKLKEKKNIPQIAYVTAGNSPTGGWAAGCWMGNGKHVFQVHRDIVSGAQAEKEGREGAEGCGNMPTTDEQTVESNVLTGVCLYRILEKMAQGVRRGQTYAGSEYWGKGEGDRVNMWSMEYRNEERR